MWLINTSEKELEFCIMEYRKFFFFKPGKPVNIPDALIAIKYKQKYRSLEECKNPEQYFIDNPMTVLINRDAGIGDLLLLEPVLKAYKQTGNKEISVITRYPEVYENNPYISNVHKADSKSSTAGINYKDYDEYIDMRSYSETAPSRDKKHRTDVYNEKFNVKLEKYGSEPGLYFGPDDKKYFKKKKNKKYIGISVDASHDFRKYPQEKELIEHIISSDKNNIVVLLGADDKNKYDSHSQIMDLRCKTTIREMINCVRCLDYMIGVDSGVMHVALTLHIPTVALFTIITPDYRMRYYTGKHKVITADVDCIGCGDFHMQACKKNPKTSQGDCQIIDPVIIYNTLNELGTDKPVEKKASNIKINIIKSDKKLTIPIIVQNEEKNLPRFIENVLSHPSIGRVVAIDGGSSDKTPELLKKAGCEVYEHPYIKTYHEQQAMQRNISCSYIATGENILIMDIDECFSKELSDYLPALAECQHGYGLISRKTFNYYKDINNPSLAIKDYPDWQPRFYKWDRKYKFVGGAHHITLNCPEPIKIKKDIIHFEKEGKDRPGLEKQWFKMMEDVKKYS
jgi:ADP-heptose:LPS heptosyltransferase